VTHPEKAISRAAPFTEPFDNVSLAASHDFSPPSIWRRKRAKSIGNQLRMGETGGERVGFELLTTF
jgi:hypothetical protein